MLRICIKRDSEDEGFKLLSNSPQLDKTHSELCWTPEGWGTERLVTLLQQLLFFGFRFHNIRSPREGVSGSQRRFVEHALTQPLTNSLTL